MGALREVCGLRVGRYVSLRLGVVLDGRVLAIRVVGLFAGISTTNVDVTSSARHRSNLNLISREGSGISA